MLKVEPTWKGCNIVPTGKILGYLNLLKTTGYVMHQQVNIQQLYVLPTLYMCFVFISE